MYMNCGMENVISFSITRFTSWLWMLSGCLHDLFNLKMPSDCIVTMRSESLYDNNGLFSITTSVHEH